MVVFNIDVAKDVISVTRDTEDGPVQDWQDYFFILAQSPTGHVYTLADGSPNGFVAAYGSEAEAREDLAKIDHDPVTKPEAWLRSTPVYGSEAWTDEDERELADFEADAYGEPRREW